MSVLKFSQYTEIGIPICIISMRIIIVCQQPGMYEDKRVVKHPVILWNMEI